MIFQPDSEMVCHQIAEQNGTSLEPTLPQLPAERNQPNQCRRDLFLSCAASKVPPQPAPAQLRKFWRAPASHKYA
jgi:hypothetical protein